MSNWFCTNPIGGNVNPIVPLTSGKKALITTILALAAIGTVVGALSVLASLGINIHFLNISLNGLRILNLYGAGALAFTSFVVLVISIAWLVCKTCCGGQEQSVKSTNLHPNNDNTLPFGGLKSVNQKEEEEKDNLRNLKNNLNIPNDPNNTIDISQEIEELDKLIEAGFNQNRNAPHLQNIKEKKTPEKKKTSLIDFVELNEQRMRRLQNKPVIPSTSLQGIKEKKTPEKNIQQIPPINLAELNTQRMRRLQNKPVIPSTSLQDIKEKNTPEKNIQQIPPINLAELNKERITRLENQKSVIPSNRLEERIQSAHKDESKDLQLFNIQAKKIKKQKPKRKSTENRNLAQPLSNRNLGLIELPDFSVEEKTGFEPLDILKRERKISTHPKLFVFLEKLKKKIKTKLVIKFSSSPTAPRAEIQAKIQREGFIHKMRHYLFGLMKGTVELGGETVKGSIYHPDEVKQVKDFITEQMESFNASLKENNLEAITLTEIVEDEVLTMWSKLLELQREKNIIKKDELDFLQWCAESGKLPKELLGLIVQIVEKPVDNDQSVLYSAFEVYKKLESALGIQKPQYCSEESPSTLVPCTSQKFAEKFQETLKNDVITLFKNNQQPPLQVCQLEQIKKYLDQEGKAFHKKYGLEINCLNLFNALFKFVDEFQLNLIPIIEERDLEKQANDLILFQDAIDKNQNIMETCFLKLDLSLIEGQMGKFDVWNQIRGLSSSKRSTEDKARLFIKCVKALPDANDLFWQKFPLLMEKIEENLSAWILNNPFPDKVECKKPGIVELMIEFEEKAKILEEKLKKTNFKLDLLLNDQPFLREVRRMRRDHLLSIQNNIKNVFRIEDIITVLSMKQEQINDIQNTENPEQRGLTYLLLLINTIQLYDPNDIKFVLAMDEKTINDIQKSKQKCSRELLKNKYSEDQLIFAGIIE